MIEEGVLAPQDFVEPSPTTTEELLLTHTKEYLSMLNKIIETPAAGISMFEIPCTKEVLDGFTLSAGGTILASRLALEQGGSANLCGGFHHAFADRGEGFCIINDIAVAIRVLQKEKLVKKIAVIDCDLHQGNGTARIFAGDKSVFTFSIHQENNYPVKEKSSWDIGLPDFAEDDLYLAKLDEAVPKILDEFKPDFVHYQAGADPYKEDQLGQLLISIDGLKKRDELVISNCTRRKIPVVATLGGGYAKRIEDVVQIHYNTVRVMKEQVSGKPSLFG